MTLSIDAIPAEELGRVETGTVSARPFRVGGMPGAAPWEPRKPGIVAVVLPDGSSRQVADDVWFPNGMVVLDDETLVLAESHADRLTAWTITGSGELVDRRVWADLGPGSAPDGLCADAEGAIWYASVPGQRCVRVVEGGEVVDLVEVDRGCFAWARLPSSLARRTCRGPEQAQLADDDTEPCRARPGVM